MATHRMIPLVAVLIMTASCAQNMKSIVIPTPGRKTPAQSCAVGLDQVLAREEALCIAKAAGLKSGINRWAIRYYGDYIDVFNTTEKFPVLKGISVRMSRVGGRVISVESWEQITVE